MFKGMILIIGIMPLLGCSSGGSSSDSSSSGRESETYDYLGRWVSECQPFSSSQYCKDVIATIETSNSTFAAHLRDAWFVERLGINNNSIEHQWDGWRGPSLGR
ncbi:MAG: hypothetical protein MI867_28695 [Pseudomonadales bacterium]|nr:hypothetical protein [Pseudomonadales bacterium]